MRTVELQLVIDSHLDNMIGVIPSTYNLCNMYDDKSVQFKITSGTEELKLSDYDVSLRFISGNIDMGSGYVKSDESGELYYPVFFMYTSNPKLEVQVILISKADNSLIRTNIILFKLGRSYPSPSDFSQSLTCLNRLISDGKLVLHLDYDNDELDLYDDLGNQIASLDVEEYVRSSNRGW